MLSDEWRRGAIGVLALVCGAVAVWLNYLDPELGAAYPQYQSLARVTPVLVLLWLTLPELQRGGFRALLVIAGLVCAAALMFRAGRVGLKFIFPALGILLLLGYLRRLTTAMSGRDRKERR